VRGASSSRGLAAGLQASLPYAVVFAAAAFFYFVAGRFQYAARPGELGPDVWPKAILALAMAVCTLQIAWQLVRPAGDSPKAESGEQSAPRVPHLLAAGIVLTLAYVAVLEYLGFFLATAAYLALFMVIGRFRRPLAVTATSLLGSLAFVFFFMKIVYVSLPLGVGAFQAVSIWILALLGVR
jgi:putative tricarboxylic transport membrane protein